jgi:DNA-binding LytR/AlgR family response regulator
MEFFAKKKDGKNISEKVEKIHSKDICYVTTEGRKAHTIAKMKDGSVYYISMPISEIVQGLEEYENFKTTDRSVTVNMDNVTYYETLYDRLFFEHNNEMREFTFITVARSYAKEIKVLMRELRVEFRE